MDTFTNSSRWLSGLHRMLLVPWFVQISQLLIAASLTFCQRVWTGLYAFCQQHEVIGTRYLVEPNERIFWGLLLILAFLGTLYCIPAFAKYFEESMFQMVIENQPQTDVLDFPSIAVCEAHTNVEFGKMKAVLKSLMMNNTSIASMKNIEALLSAIAFADYHQYNTETFRSFYNLSKANGNLQFFDELNYKEIAEKLRSTCKELFHGCKWRGKKFDCCEYFLPIEDSTQVCFVLNSEQTESPKYLEMKIEKYIPNREFELVLNAEVRVFALNPNDIPQHTSPLAKSPPIPPGSSFVLVFQLLMNYNDPELYKLSPKLIRCWPPNYQFKETFITYKHASETSCLTDCLRLLQWKTCGCIKHTLKEGIAKAKAPYCNLSGYVCLEQHGLYSIFSLETLPPTTCDYCLPLCKRQSISVVDTSFLDYDDEVVNKKRAKVTLELNHYPIRRTRRQVIRNYVDIAVLLGGIISLFIGFSLVHMIELLYYIVSAFVQPNFLN